MKSLLERKRLPGKVSEKVVNFLGNQKSDNYVEIVDNLLDRYKELGCNMSLKIHFLHSHLDFFPSNCGDVNDEHGERFHQDVSTMLADFCWNLQRDAPEVIYKRKSLSNSTAKHV